MHTPCHFRSLPCSASRRIALPRFKSSPTRQNRVRTCPLLAGKLPVLILYTPQDPDRLLLITPLPLLSTTPPGPPSLSRLTQIAIFGLECWSRSGALYSLRHPRRFSFHLATTTLRFHRVSQRRLMRCGPCPAADETVAFRPGSITLTTAQPLLAFLLSPLTSTLTTSTPNDLQL